MLSVVLAIEIAVGVLLTFPSASVALPPLPNMQGYPACAVEFVQEAVDAIRPDVAYDWNQLADVFFAAGFYAEAEACYQQATKLSPEHAEWRMDFAFCLSSIGDIEGSDREYRHCLMLGPRRPEDCFYFLGMNALREKRTEDATVAFQQAIKLPAARYQLARLAMLDGKIESANAVLEQLVTEVPRSWNPHHLLAVGAQKVGDEILAAKHVALADVLSEPVFSPWHDRAQKLRELGLSFGAQHQVNVALKELQRPNAIQRVQASIEADNTVFWSPLLEDLLSEVEYLKGNTKRQVQRLESIIQKDGLNAYRAVRLAVACLASGEREQGKELLRSGIHILSGGQGQEPIDMARMLAQLLADEGKAEESGHYLALVDFLQGTSEVDELRIPAAATSFQRAVEREPSVDRYWYWLGRTRQMLTDHSAAIEAYDACLKINPYHERAAGYREALLKSGSGATPTAP